MSGGFQSKQSEADSTTVAQTNEARDLDLATDETAISDDENKLKIAISSENTGERIFLAFSSEKVFEQIAQLRQE